MNTNVRWINWLWKSSKNALKFKIVLLDKGKVWWMLELRIQVHWMMLLAMGMGIGNAGTRDGWKM